jgi:hypothetical protein
MTRILKNKLHDFWTQYIKGKGPQFLVTITIKESKHGILQDEKFVSLMNDLFYLMNSMHFRKRYQRGEQHFSGLAVLEHQSNGMPHLHILIENEDITVEELKELLECNTDRFCYKIDTSTHFDRRRLRNAVRWGVPKKVVEKDAIKRYIRRVSLMDKKCLDVRHIDQSPEDFTRLAGYLMKEAPEFMFLGKEGFM